MPAERPSSGKLLQHAYVTRPRSETVLLELIARTKSAVRELDNLNYRKMKKILMVDTCETESAVGDTDDQQDDHAGGDSSKSNSITSEHSIHSVGVSAASSQVGLTVYYLLYASNCMCVSSAQSSSSNSIPAAAQNHHQFAAHHHQQAAAVAAAMHHQRELQQQQQHLGNWAAANAVQQQQQQHNQGASGGGGGGAVSRNSSRHRNLPPLPNIMHSMNNNVTPTNSASVVPAPAPAPPLSVIPHLGIGGTGNMVCAGGGGGSSTGGSPAGGDHRLPGLGPRYLSTPAAQAAVYAATSASSQQAISNAVNDHGPNNFATIRTTSIVTKQQKEHMQVRYTALLHTYLFYTYTHTHTHMCTTTTTTTTRTIYPPTAAVVNDSYFSLEPSISIRGQNRLQMQSIDKCDKLTLHCAPLLSPALFQLLLSLYFMCLCVLSASSPTPKNKSLQLTFPVALVSRSLSLSSSHYPKSFALLLHAIFVVVYCFLLSSRITNRRAITSIPNCAAVAAAARGAAVVSSAAAAAATSPLLIPMTSLATLRTASSRRRARQCQCQCRAIINVPV